MWFESERSLIHLHYFSVERRRVRERPGAGEDPQGPGLLLQWHHHHPEGHAAQLWRTGTTIFLVKTQIHSVYHWGYSWNCMDYVLICFTANYMLIEMWKCDVNLLLWLCDVWSNQYLVYQGKTKRLKKSTKLHLRNHHVIITKNPRVSM